MSESSSPSGQPSVAQAAPVSAPAAAPVAASSSTTQSDINAQVKTATSPAALRELARQLRDNPQVRLNTAKPAAQPTPPPPAAPAVQETPAEAPTATEAETPAPEAEQASSETPAEESTEQPPATPEDAPEEEDGGDGPVTPLTGKRTHLRLNEADEVGKLALAFQKRNRDWTLEQAIDAAKKQLGVDAPQKAKDEPAKPQLPQTVEEVDNATKQKLAEYKKAMAEVRFEDAADINAELLQLSLHRSTLERRAEQEQARSEREYNQKYDASEAKAIEMYPFAADANSPGGKRMREIERDLKENGDPLYFSAEKPLRIAQMVAAELHIAPKSKTPPTKPVAAPAQPAPKKGVIPSGSSRATPPPANQPPAIDAEIKAISNPYQLQQLRKKLGLPA